MDINACTELIVPKANFNPTYATNRDRPDLWRDERPRPTDEELARADVKYQEWLAQEKINDKAQKHLDNTDIWTIRFLGQNMNSKRIDTKWTQAEFDAHEELRDEMRDLIVHKTFDKLGTEIRAELVNR